MKTSFIFLVTLLFLVRPATEAALIDGSAPGQLDLSFDFDHGPFPNVFALTLQPDGKLVIGGRFSSVQGKGRDDIARFNADGGVDRAFKPMSGTGPAENYVVYAVAHGLDQRLLIGGRFSSVNGVPRSNLARLHR